MTKGPSRDWRVVKRDEERPVYFGWDRRICILYVLCVRGSSEVMRLGYGSRLGTNSVLQGRRPWRLRQRRPTAGGGGVDRSAGRGETVTISHPTITKVSIVLVRGKTHFGFKSTKGRGESLSASVCVDPNSVPNREPIELTRFGVKEPFYPRYDRLEYSGNTSVVPYVTHSCYESGYGPWMNGNKKD